MRILPLPNPAADRARAHARWNPERETLELATAGAAKVLGPDHGVTKALAKGVDHHGQGRPVAGAAGREDAAP